MEHNIKIPIPPLQDRLNLNIQFLIPDAISPKELGEDDSRKIGIGIISYAIAE